MCLSTVKITNSRAIITCVIEVPDQVFVHTIIVLIVTLKASTLICTCIACFWLQTLSYDNHTHVQRWQAHDCHDNLVICTVTMHTCLLTLWKPTRKKTHITCILKCLFKNCYKLYNNKAVYNLKPTLTNIIFTINCMLRIITYTQ